MGAPRASEKQSWAGHACFLFGGTTGQLGLSDCDGLIEAEHEDTLLGLSLAAVPDVNGDGFPEVIFGAGQLPDGDEGIGGAFLFLGGSL